VALVVPGHEKLLRVFTAGCKTVMPELPHRYFSIDFYADSAPTQSMSNQLINMLDQVTPEIIDEIGFLIDNETGQLMWATKDLEKEIKHKFLHDNVDF